MRWGWVAGQGQVAGRSRLCASCAMSQRSLAGFHQDRRPGAVPPSGCAPLGLWPWFLPCRPDSGPRLPAFAGGHPDTVSPPQRGILEQQQRERSDDSFRGVCMFCSEEFLGNRFATPRVFKCDCFTGETHPNPCRAGGNQVRGLLRSLRFARGVSSDFSAGLTSKVDCSCSSRSREVNFLNAKNRLMSNVVKLSKSAGRQDRENKLP